MSYMVVKIFNHETGVARVHDYLKSANLVDTKKEAGVNKKLNGKLHIKDEIYFSTNFGVVGGGLLRLLFLNRMQDSSIRRLSR